MTPLGLTRDAGHRYTWSDGETTVGPLVSVTTVIGIKDKPALVPWAKRETAECAVRNLSMLNDMVATGGPRAAVDWLKRIPDYQRDAAADLGTRVHAVAEQIGMGRETPVTDDEAPFVAAYLRDFIGRYKPTFLETEAMVASLRYGYAGTADAFLVIDGETWLVDYKTSKGVYPDTALQLAGLARAEFLGRPGDPHKYPIPKATRFGVVHIRPERARLVPYRIGRSTFAAFLDARRLWEWDAKEAKQVMEEVA